jgi:hypothetical protein
MEANDLRALQAPLKQRYRDEPGAALLTLRASGTLDSAAIACRVETGRALVEAGLHPATGGTGLQACSGDLLLTALEIPIRSGRLRAEGDLDFRGTLGVAKEVPVGFQAIRLSVELDTDAAPEQLERLLSLTERYCVVLQTLRRPPELSLERAGSA